MNDYEISLRIRQHSLIRTDVETIRKAVYNRALNNSSPNYQHNLQRYIESHCRQLSTPS